MSVHPEDERFLRRAIEATIRIGVVTVLVLGYTLFMAWLEVGPVRAEASEDA